MKLVNGNTYMNDKKTNKVYKYLDRNIETEILIVGGGITSAITAWYLAKAGYSIVIAEKNVLGYGSSRASSALLDYQAEYMLKDLINEIGEKRAESIYKKSLESIKDLELICNEIKTDVEFKILDSVIYTDNKSKISTLEEEYELRKNKGYDVTLVDKIDSNVMKKCLVTKNASATINPYLFLISVFKYLEKKYNIKIYENTRIDNSISNENAVVSITNNDKIITSKHLILATGYDAQNNIKDKNTKVYATYSIITDKIENLSRLNINYTAMDLKKPYHFYRFTKDNRILFGGEDILLGNNKLDSDKMREISNKKFLKLYENIKKHFYMIPNIKVKYAYSAVFADTKDTLPIIDKLPNLDNAYCNLAYGGSGIIYGVIGAKYLKDIIQNNIVSPELEMFEINRKI